MTNRKAALLEALKAVQNERLSTHEERLREAENINLYRQEHGEDAAYSLAIHHAESAIKALMAGSQNE